MGRPMERLNQSRSVGAIDADRRRRLGEAIGLPAASARQAFQRFAASLLDSHPPPRATLIPEKSSFANSRRLAYGSVLTLVMIVKAAWPFAT